MNERYTPEVHLAVDRLNSWVRSSSARHGGFTSSPQYAIYDWKHALIDHAIKNQLTEPWAIRLPMTCRACGGSGKYTDWYGIKYDNCRKCASSGKVVLHFLVTKVHGFTWHTPKDKAWKFRLPAKIWEMTTLEAVWQPNQPGRDMEPWEVAACLNVLEPVMPKPGSHGVFDGFDYYGEKDHAKYRLYIGRSGRFCQMCLRDSKWNPADPESKQDGCYHCVTRGPIEFSSWACDLCRDRYKNDGCKIFSLFPAPKIEHPEILAWMERHREDFKETR